MQYAQQDQLLKTMWEAAGMKVTLDSQAQADQIIQVILGNYQAADFRLFGQPDPDSDFYWWSSGTIAPVGGVSLNMARFANATTEAGLATGRARAPTRRSATRPTRRSRRSGTPTSPTSGWPAPTG